MFKKLIVLVLTAVLLVSCTPEVALSSQEVSPTVVDDVALVETVESSDSVANIDVENDAIVKILPLVKVEMPNYDPMWEYLEYGDVIEYCPNGSDTLSVVFYATDKGYTYGDIRKFDLEFEPPQFRALKDVLGESYSGGYTVEVEISNDLVSGLLSILDTEGDILWERGSSQEPRDFNAVEQAFLKASELYSYRNNYLDLEEGCISTNSRVSWSPLETDVRSHASKMFLTNQDNVWLSVLASYNPEYGDELRWVDTGGNTLESMWPSYKDSKTSDEYEFYILPDDGTVILQFREMDYRTWEHSSDWNTLYSVKIKSGFMVITDTDSNPYVVSIYSDLNYCRGENCLEALDAYLAISTGSWTEDEIIDGFWSYYDWLSSK